MKRKNVAILSFAIVMIIAIIAVVFPKNKASEVITNTHYEKESSMISMMLETSLGSGTYEASNNTTWPEEGYNLNTNKSGCENGGKITFNEESKKVVVKTNISDKCYVYFDKYNKAKINSVTSSDIGETEFKITANVTVGSSPIDVYYFSIDNGSTWNITSTNTYAATELKPGTEYKIKVKVVDKNKKESNEFSTTVKTIIYLQTYVKSLYTTQGSNGIYLHNSSLTNGAGDNSYRYAGGNPANYVCFGSDDKDCSYDDLYRIVGVFGNQVKLIKSDYANKNVLGTDGNYASESSTSGQWYKGSHTLVNQYTWGVTGNNTWSESKLNTVNLNKNYIDYLNSKDTKWVNMIADTTWNVGGMGWTNGVLTNAQTAFKYEVGANKLATTYSAKIGLIYLSDYYYAAIPQYWTYPGLKEADQQDYRLAINDNWISQGSWMEWTISRYSSNNTQTFVFSTSTSNSLVEYHRVVRPSFYLKNNIKYISGNGKSTDPYRIK